jgi:hypothetical protein
MGFPSFPSGRDPERHPAPLESLEVLGIKFRRLSVGGEIAITQPPYQLGVAGTLDVVRAAGRAQVQDRVGVAEVTG